MFCGSFIVLIDFYFACSTFINNFWEKKTIIFKREENSRHLQVLKVKTFTWETEKKDICVGHSIPVHFCVFKLFCN